MVVAERNDDLAAADDHRNQRIFAHMQILQGNADVGICSAGSKFNGLCTAMHQPIQLFHLGALHILTGTYIAENVGAGDSLGADDAVQPHGADNVRIGDTVVLHNDLGNALPHGEQAGHQVFLVTVSQGDKGVHLLQTFLLQQALICAVAVDYVHVRQNFAQFFRLFVVDFNQGNVGADRHDHLGKVVADTAAAQDHHVFHLMGVSAKETEIIRNCHHIGCHVHPVTGLNHEIAVGDGD